ncbi:MAG: divalent-cation tolerance protein CutA [Candidatus Bathyarchaeota archaeon]|nr:divalent-cation tolerance protein CutA [Candidatus Bathyarchaeota archaeon]
MDKAVIILTTTQNKTEAEKIANTLLEQRLIACANITAVSSRYWWNQKIECSEECLVIMKSRQELFERVVEQVKLLHSYEVPEVLALPVLAGSADYLAWIFDTLSSNVRFCTDKP